MRVRRAVGVAALAAAAVSFIAGMSAQSPPLVIGTVDGHGTVIPFAQYDVGTWSKVWPAPIEVSRQLPPLPAALDARFGHASSWYVWTRPDHLETLTAAAPVRATLGCEVSAGLPTDFAWKGFVDEGMMAVATTDQRTHVERFVTVLDSNVPASAERRALVDSFMRVVQPVFDAAEAKDADAWARGHERATMAPAAVREKLPLVLPRVVESPALAGGVRLYHFEARRSLRTKGPAAATCRPRCRVGCSRTRADRAASSTATRSSRTRTATGS